MIQPTTSLKRAFLAALGLLATASSFRVPAGQPDGAYSITVDAAGKEVHTLIANVTEGPPRLFKPRGVGLTERATSWPSGSTMECPQDYLWATNFYEQGGAWEQFYNQCWVFDSANSKMGTHYFIKGQALAYFCNYDGERGSRCRVQEWVDFVDWASNTCTQGTDGWKQAAWVNFHGAWEKSYGFTHTNNNFC